MVGEGSLRSKDGVWEYIRSLLIALLIAVTIRSFVVEAFKIPSSSMVPTLLIGDHLFVNKWTYGIRVPFTHWWPYKRRDPNPGEVVVFLYPRDESLNYIKRLIGRPGDEIRVHGHSLSINGKDLAHREVPPPPGVDPSAPYIYYEEQLNGVSYMVRYRKDYGERDQTYKVPAGGFFVMGDNRDNSQDSRIWGAVPRENFKGEAMFIWLSRDYRGGAWFELSKGWRWERFGNPITKAGVSSSALTHGHA